jgi:NADH:ubiquinone oxidoreductase subunit E
VAKEQSFVDQCRTERGDFLIPILQDIQEKYNYLPEESLREVADRLQVPLRDVYGVATFYRSFSLTPKGKHIFTVCVGTACHVRGGARLAKTISRELDIKPGETTEDMQFSLETVNCLGCCAIGPIMVADGEYHGQMTSQRALDLLKKYRGEKNDSGKS